ncbi:MAG: hypothetical protein Kow00121_49220 [Elainellaceae cyanobacterium]
MTQMSSNSNPQSSTNNHAPTFQPDQVPEQSMINSSSSYQTQIASETGTPQVSQPPQFNQPFNTAGGAEPTPPSRRITGLSVRAKATALAVALGVIPVLVIGGGATYFANQIITERTLAEKREFASAMSLRLNEFVRGRLQDAQTIANAPFMKDEETLEATPPEAIVEYFDTFVEQDPTYAQITTVTPQGGFAFLEDGLGFRSTKGSYTPEFDQQRSFFAERNIPYFLDVRDTLRPTVTPLRVSTGTGESAFYISVPVLDDANRLDYVVYSRTDAEVISALINEFASILRNSLGEDQQTAIKYRVIDHSRAYFERNAEGEEEEILSTRIEINGDSIKIDGQEFQPGGNIFTKESRVFVSDDDQGIAVEMQTIFPKYAELRQGGVATVTTDISQEDGQEYLLSYVPVPPVAELPFDWGVLIYEPSATAFAPQRTLTLTILLGTGIAAVLVGAIAAWFANRATKPLLEATDAIERIGQGELDTRVDIRGEDELARLGANINRTAEQIRQLLEEKALVTEQARLNIITGVTGSELRNSEDLKVALNDALQVARENLDVDRVVIYQFNSDGSGSITAESVKPGFPRALERVINDACIPEDLLEAYRQGRVVQIQDTAQARLHPKHLELLESLNVRSSLVVPILQGNQLFGLLVAHHCVSTYEWQESEIAFLKYLSAQLGLAIDRVSFLEQLRQTAEEQRRVKEALQLRALELLKEVDPISKGDLTIRAKVTADEIGTIADSYNATVDSLRKIVLQVQQAASQVTSTTSQNETSVRSLSEEALRQAEEIATALDVVRDLADAVQAVAANAEQAEVVVRQASETVAAGDIAMNRTVEGIQTIRATVAETAKKVKRLGESSQRISTVVDLISAFAAQTNMLALNASIEASRAGEQGRGFSVVANEVRTLARQSADATEEIKKLVASIQSETNEVVTAMETGTEQVVIGTQLVDETRRSLNNIAAASTQINQLVLAIAQATVVQSQASETVTKTMKDVAAIASKTSNEAQQVSSSFEQLRQVAQMLQQEVNQFRVS